MSANNMALFRIFTLHVLYIFCYNIHRNIKFYTLLALELCLYVLDYGGGTISVDSFTG